MVKILHRLILICALILSGCQTASEIKPAAKYHEEVEKNSIALIFKCEPELNSRFKKRTESLVGYKATIQFYGPTGKFIERKALLINPKANAVGSASVKTLETYATAELSIKNKKLNLTKEELKDPILLPDSVCDAN